MAGLCDLKISDFQGFFDFAYQMLQSEDFDWDSLIDQLADLGVPPEALAEIEEGISYIQDNPELLALSKAEVDAYLDEYGDIPLCDLIENIDTGGFDPSVPNDLTGTAGVDFFFVGAGNDTVDGGAGDDMIGGADGDDLIFGGLGADIIFGGAGNDRLYTEALDQLVPVAENIMNVIWAGLGNDSLFGATGGDIMGGGTGNDSVSAGGGADIVYGGKGDESASGVNDIVDAGDGDDAVYGSGGNDSIDGGSGNDTLFSGAGSDTVDGGSGDDEIWGGAGDDDLTGGAGADTFGFIAGSGVDDIPDFEVGTDKLDLSALFATRAEVEAASSDSAGGLSIALDGGEIVLAGVSMADFDQLEILV